MTCAIPRFHRWLAGATAALLLVGLAPTSAAVAPTKRGQDRAINASVADASQSPTKAVGAAKKRKKKRIRTDDGSRPNIVVVMMDDMRADEMAYVPNVGREITQRGMTFANSFSPFPLCCPARASFLTGEYAHNHGVVSTEAPWGFGSFDDSSTLAGRLQGAGYNTAMIGKYLNGYGWMNSRVTGGPSARYKPAGWTDWMASLDTNALELPTLGKGGTYNYLRFRQNINGRIKMRKRPRYSADVIADQAVALIKKYHARPRPFFLWLTPVNPHVGAPADPGDPAAYTKADGSVQTFLTPYVPVRNRGMFNGWITHSPGIPINGVSEADVTDKPDWVRTWLPNTAYENAAMTEVERQRAASIYAWDRRFGRIVNKLKATGEYGNTIFFFTSDNGYYLGEHRQPIGKINAHEPSLRVPLAVAGPGIAQGTSYAPASTIDLPDTILELAKLAAMPNSDGASLVPDLQASNRGWTRALVVEGRLMGRPESGDVPARLSSSGIRTGRYKYIRYSNGEEELYDELRDPNELTSLHDEPDSADLKRRLIGLWNSYKRCRGNSCRWPLPPDLQMSPSQLRGLDDNAKIQYQLYYNR